MDGVTVRINGEYGRAGALHPPLSVEVHVAAMERPSGFLWAGYGLSAGADGVEAVPPAAGRNGTCMTRTAWKPSLQ